MFVSIYHCKESPNFTTVTAIVQWGIIRFLIFALLQPICWITFPYPLFRGSFSIHNGFKHGTLCDPVYAHPSGKIHRKVYEYSKLMPEVLHFELFPCGELWTNLFQEYGLDRKNIGLYFLPSASKRYISIRHAWAPVNPPLTSTSHVLFYSIHLYIIL